MPFTASWKVGLCDAGWCRLRRVQPPFGHPWYIDWAKEVVASSPSAESSMSPVSSELASSSALSKGSSWTADTNGLSVSALVASGTMSVGAE